MGLNIGSSPMTAARVGSTPISKVFVGSQEVWPSYTPPADKVLYWSSQVTAGVSGTFPSHVAGDLLVVVAGATSALYPTVPTGWTKAYQTPDTNRPMVIGWKAATASGTASGSWSNAAYVTTYVFRGVDTTNPFGSIDTALSATSPAITPVDPSGRSQIVHTRWQSGGTGTWSTTVPNLKARNTVASMCNGEQIDTRTAPELTWAISGGTPAYRSLVFEICAPPL